MNTETPNPRWAVTGLLFAPVLHPLLLPVVGVPSHLLWFVHVLPVAWWTYHRGRTAGALAIGASLLMLIAGERTFGAGYFIAADWRTAVALAVALAFTCTLVAGFALYARKVFALQQQLWHAQKLEMLGLFAASVAHDFNNVLTAITLSSELALEALPRGHAVRGHVQEVAHSADRAAMLTKRLLAFARRDIAEQPSPVSVNAVVEGLEVMLGRIVARNVDLLVTLGDMSLVLYYPGHVEQILTNLVVNASDAMPDGGIITIETATVSRERAIPPSGTRPACSYAMLSVTDTGVGIDSSAHTRIFEPLYTTKAPGKGTGLGLSTVKSLVNECGGFVTVTSVRHRGSTFRVFLPVMSEVDRQKECTSVELDATAWRVSPFVRGVVPVAARSRSFAALRTAACFRR